MEKNVVPKCGIAALTYIAMLYKEQKTVTGDERANLLIQIRDEICRVFKLTPSVLFGGGRTEDVLLPRQVFYYVADSLCGCTSVELAMFSKRDHTTILAARKRVSALLDTKDQKFLDYCSRYLNEAKFHLVPKQPD